MSRHGGSSRHKDLLPTTSCPPPPAHLLLPTSSSLPIQLLPTSCPPPHFLLASSRRYAAAGKEVPDEILEKMSTLPSGAVTRLVPEDPEAWPILQCGNVFVLPGVPQFFASKLDTIATHFLEGKTRTLHAERTTHWFTRLHAASCDPASGNAASSNAARLACHRLPSTRAP